MSSSIPFRPSRKRAHDVPEDFDPSSADIIGNKRAKHEDPTSHDKSITQSQSLLLQMEDQVQLDVLGSSGAPPPESAMVRFSRSDSGGSEDGAPPIDTRSICNEDQEGAVDEDDEEEDDEDDDEDDDDDEDHEDDEPPGSPHSRIQKWRAACHSYELQAETADLANDNKDADLAEKDAELAEKDAELAEKNKLINDLARQNHLWQRHGNFMEFRHKAEQKEVLERDVRIAQLKLDLASARETRDGALLVVGTPEVLAEVESDVESEEASEDEEASEGEEACESEEASEGDDASEDEMDVSDNADDDHHQVLDSEDRPGGEEIDEDDDDHSSDEDYDGSDSSSDAPDDDEDYVQGDEQEDLEDVMDI